MDVFTTISVSTRRNITEMLASRGKLSATDIYDRFNTCPPAISQHLKALREAKLVMVEKQGQQRMYELNLEGIYESETKKNTCG